MPASLYSNHPLYHIYQEMISRCDDPASKYYWHYGARGTSICNRWRAHFELFKLDIGTPEHAFAATLIRIDQDKDYEPTNCRWKQQINASLAFELEKPSTTEQWLRKLKGL